jgi:catechol 2,3-dioxygenase-like lactoylglutathione lyase family enzyme
MDTSRVRPAGAAILVHVALLSADIDESLRFYRDGLGLSRTYQWTETATPDGDVVFRGRGVLIELGGNTYLELLGGSVPPTGGPVHHIAIAVEDVGAAYERCLAAGGQPVRDGDWSGHPTTVHVNGTPSIEVCDAFVRGPSGEVVELYELRSSIPAR